VLSQLGYPALRFQPFRPRHSSAIRDSRAAEAPRSRLCGAIEDNRLAAQWLAKNGFADPIVIGHSNGGMLCSAARRDHPGAPALVLRRAHCGGRTLLPLACSNGLWRRAGWLNSREKALHLVKSGKPRRADAAARRWYAITAESFLDLERNCPDISSFAPRIACPVALPARRPGAEGAVSREEFAGKNERQLRGAPSFPTAIISMPAAKTSFRPLFCRWLAML